LVYLTFGLVLVTFGLAIYTAKLYHATVGLGKDARNTSDRQATEMEKSLTIAKEAANAAQKSADALPLVEKAYLFIFVELGNKLASPYQTNGDMLFSIHTQITNHGKTPAILNKISGYRVNQDSCPTISTAISPPALAVPSGIVVGCGTPYNMTDSPGLVIPSAEWEQIIKGQIKLFWYGRIEYKDVLGGSRETGFCWEFFPDAENPSFTISDSDLNYYK
jgi:hypothetical protein